MLRKEVKMKKEFFGLLVLSVFLIMFAACVTTDPNAPLPSLEGKWYHPNPDSLNSVIEFKGNTFVYSWDGGSATGTFTQERNKIDFTLGKALWTQTYKLAANTLLMGDGGQQWYGAYEGPHWYGLYKLVLE
jgi:hypothetical protein